MIHQFIQQIVSRKENAVERNFVSSGELMSLLLSQMSELKNKANRRVGREGDFGKLVVITSANSSNWGND
jgi:hypothetical protein